MEPVAAFLRELAYARIFAAGGRVLHETHVVVSSDGVSQRISLISCTLSK